MVFDLNFTTKFLSTDKVGQVDALSRLVDSYRKQPEDTVVAAVSVEPEVSIVLASRSLPVTESIIYYGL